MSQSNSQRKSEGMALVEIVIALIVLAVIVTGGIYVMRHNASNNQAASTTTVQPGTSASVDRTNQNEATKETQASQNADTQTQQSITSSNTTVSNVGGAYDETTF